MTNIKRPTPIDKIEVLSEEEVHGVSLGVEYDHVDQEYRICVCQSTVCRLEQRRGETDFDYHARMLAEYEVVELTLYSVSERLK